MEARERIAELTQKLNDANYRYYVMDDPIIPDFEYDEALYQDSTWWKHLMYGAHCSKCKSVHEEYELFPVKGLDGTPKFYCCNCIADHVDWCDECKEAYEVENIEEAKHLCKECAEKYNV